MDTFAFFSVMIYFLTKVFHRFFQKYQVYTDNILN
nr:MAG TPA: hypothetical protein [Caudoviricetes sp.]